MVSIHRRTVRWTTQDGHQRTGQRWQARYVGEDRKEHAKLFALKKDAQRWLDQQTVDLIRGDWTDPAAGKETLRTYATCWERIQVSAEGTARIVDNALRVHILPRLGDMPLGSIRRSDVQAFVKALEEKEVRPATEELPARTMSPALFATSTRCWRACLTPQPMTESSRPRRARGSRCPRTMTMRCGCQRSRASSAFKWPSVNSGSRFRSCSRARVFASESCSASGFPTWTSCDARSASSVNGSSRAGSRR